MATAQQLSIDTSNTALDLANEMFGSGIQVLSATFNGSADATSIQAGIYSGALTTIPGLSPTDTGVILSTGNAQNFAPYSDGTTNTNRAAGTTTDTGGVDGDPQLNTLAGANTFDAAIFQASFIPDANFITLQFVFSSEEYLEYVSGGFNDAFGVWVNGVFAPVTPLAGGTAAIDTINLTQNPNLFLNNPAGTDPYNSEMDGLTRVLTVKAPVNAGQVNSIKIAIADAGDAQYDSNVLIMGNSIQTMAIAVQDNVNMLAGTTRTIDVLSNDTDATDGGLTITQINGTNVVPGGSVALPSGEVVTLNPDGTLTIQTNAGTGASVFTYTVLDSAGNTDVGFVNLTVVSALAPDGIVHGTTGGDLIQTGYLGDPDGDRVDNNDALGVGGTSGDGDYVLAMGGNDTVRSGAGNDIVYAGSGNDSVDAGAGNDYVSLGEGDDTLGSWSADNGGNDTIDGDGGNDQIIGGAGNDIVYGGTGNDTLSGQHGADTLFGGAGADAFWITDDHEGDTVSGDDGVDQIAFGNFLTAAGITVTATGNDSGTYAFNATPGGFTQGQGSYSSIEALGLTSFADSYNGSAASGDTTVEGGAGNDTMTGGASNDALYGGGDNDILTSGGGADTLSGGAGADRLVFNTTFANGTAIGGADYDTLDLSTYPNAVTVVFTGAGQGTITDQVTGAVVTFSEIEEMILTPQSDVVDATADDGYTYIQTRNGNDLITGSDGDDVYDDEIGTPNGQGNDTFYGAGGNDVLWMGSNDDLAYGGTGNDYLGGEAGNDTLHGDDGNDTVAGFTGNDVLTGGAGADSVTGDEGDDRLTGDAGTDSLFGGTGQDTLIGGADADSLYGGDDADVIHGAAGDVVAGGEGGTDNDTLVLNWADVQSIAYGGGNNEAGTVTFTAASGGGTLTFTEIEAIRYKGPVDGTTGDDVMTIGHIDAQGDIIDGADGDVDTIFGYGGNDSINAGADTDLVYGGTGNDTVLGGGGSDTILGEDGADSLFGEAGDDSIFGGDGADMVDGDAGSDSLSGDAGNDTLVGDDGNDTLSGGTGDDQIHASGGDNLASGDAGADQVYMGTGADTLFGGAGNDTMGAGAGNDLLYGDRISFVPGDHASALSGAASGFTFQNNSSQTVTLYWVNPSGVLESYGDFAPGTSIAQVTYAGHNWVIYDTATGLPLEYIGYPADGSVITYADGNDNLSGDAGNDTLHGEAGADALYGGDDADWLFGGAGDDTLGGDAGDDSLEGGDGNDSLMGGQGADTLLGGAGNDTLDGGDGDDQIFAGDGADLIVAGDGNDYVLGEGGADTLYGGAGNDTLLSRADSDLAYGGDGNDLMLGLTGNDTFFGGTGSDSMFGGADNDLLDGDEGDDSIFGDDGDDSLLGDTGLDTLHGGSGNDTLDGGGDADELLGDGGADSVIGGAGADTAYGGTGADTIAGGADNDLLFGGDDGDLLQGEGGDDVLWGDLGADTLDGGDGNDTLIGGDSGGTDTAADLIYGGAGNDLVEAGAGDDTVDGGDGTDTIRGEAGDDLLSGGGDRDLFVMAPGGGTDTIAGGESGDDYDTIDTTGIAAALDVRFTGDEAGEFGDTGGSVGANFTEIEALDLGSGNDTVDASATTGGIDINAGAGDDRITGGSGADTLTGGLGGDTITGGAGNDAIDLGAGDGAEDRVILADGAGSDTITGFAAPVDSGGGIFTGLDQLDVSSLTDASGAPVNTDDVTVSDDGAGNAVLTFPNGESITLVGVAVAAVALPAQLAAMGIPMPDYVVEGTAGGDLIDAGYTADPEGDMVDAGDNPSGTDGDVIQAGDGDDTVLAGQGDDSVHGGTGADSLLGEAGDDQIYGGSGDDTLAGGAGRDYAEGGSGNDSLAGGLDDDTLFGGLGNDRLDGGDGDDWLNGGEEDDAVFGGRGNDTLTGQSGSDTLDGGDDADLFNVAVDAGNTLVVGGEGGTDSDTLSLVASTNGVIVTFTGNEAGTATHGPGTSEVVTFSEIETLVLTGQSDRLDAGATTDGVAVQAGAGADTLIGGSGQDTLDGGTGADTVDAGAGDDRIVLGGDGAADLVVLADGDGSDIIIGLDAPIDNGDGTYAGVDLLDVSGLTDASGAPVNTGDVTVSDDGAGNAVLIFPNGESITLVGIAPATADNPAWLQAIGIPAPDFVVEGTAGDDLIDGGYLGDPEGDLVDAGDNAAGTDADVIEAGTGDDTVLAGAGNDTVHGGDGADIIDGGAGDDSLEGGDGADSILGDDGNDTVRAGNGDDTVSGGAGDDSLFGFTGSDVVYGGDGNDLINTRAETGTGAPDRGYPGLFPGDPDADNDRDTVEGGAGNDTILTGDDADFVAGGEGADSIDGGFDDDTLQGDAGDDTILGGEGRDFIEGGTGSDLIFGGLTLGEADALNLTDDVDLVPDNNNDTIFGDDGDDTIRGMDDADELYGGADNDLLDGGIDNDTLSGDSGNDTLLGGHGDDALDGGDGADSLDGGDGRDTLAGGTGDDTLAGGAAQDTMQVADDGGADTIRGGEGGPVDDDTLDLSAVTTATTVTYAGAEAGALTHGTGSADFAEIERLRLGSGDDTVTAASDAGPVIVSGGDGADTLVLDGRAVNVADIGFDDTVSGSFTPANGGAAIAFGPSEALQLSDVLAAYKNGTLSVQGANLSGTLGDVTFDSFESAQFNVICFVRGTRIKTAAGEVAIEDLAEGDRVLTLDNGYQPIRWIGSSCRAAVGALAPVRIAAGALGNDRDLLVSPQHRMLLRGWQANLMFGEAEVLVAAKALVNDRTIRVQQGGEVEYFHMLFDRHEIVFAEGAAAESFHPGQQGWKALDAATRAEILGLFPQLADGDFAGYGPAARLSLKDYEGRILADAMLPRA